ncbi:M4 family metallopeptidase [Pontibacter sp. MBLB2868]|uniref:M4 family metallopeptidase n=1 Tax=Pontibacter sp. MBLB2868 TaxID=3451555 RepID=UPI003F74D62F
MKASFTSKVLAASVLFSLTVYQLSAQENGGLMADKKKKEVEFSVSSTGQRKAAPQGALQSPFKQLRYNEQVIKSKEAGSGDVKINRSKETGLPLSIKSKPASNARLMPLSEEEVKSASFTFLERYKTALQVVDPKSEFEVTSVSKDELGQTHVRLQQKYKGVPVYGAQLITHTQNNQISLLNGRHFSTPKVDTTPSLSSSQAEQTAVADLKKGTMVRELSAGEKKLLQYDKPTSELIIYHTGVTKSVARLAWHINARPNVLENWTYIVDARTGEVLSKQNNTCTLFAGTSSTGSGTDLKGVSRTFNTYQEEGLHYLVDTKRPMFNNNISVLDEFVGAIETYDAQSSSPSSEEFYADRVVSTTSAFDQPVAVSAHYNAGVAYDYFLNVHGRNSINGQGGSIYSIVNIADVNGNSIENAFWNDVFIAYGNGGDNLKPLAASLDIAGHEMSHGVVSNSANLEYYGQSGAINESISDIFGAMMDREDWKVGEDVVKLTSYPSGAARDISNPHNGGVKGDNSWQPAHMSEYVHGEDDNGGVHSNSGIVNYAYYLIATDISKEKAEKIYYRALTQYLTKSSQFIDLRIAVVQAATDLYGAASAEVGAVASAFDAVGILEVTSDAIAELPVNPGQDFIMVYSVDETDTDFIYASTTDASQIIPMSSTKAISKLSITDDGSVAFFVDANHMIKAIDLLGDQGEIFVDNQPIWDYVAVSKDGTKLAMAKSVGEPYIYVRDLRTNQQRQFQLYNPTTSSDGSKSGGVLYPDALEWDYSGEFVIYDAANRLNSSDGTAIEFWDVGVIYVWDNIGNGYAEGQVQKLFTDLPQGVSIGNPSFAKNSPYIMAFDLIQASSSSVEYSVLAANLETGDAHIVYENDRLGYPSYSKLDDMLIFDTSTGSEATPVTAVIGLASNKLEPVGSAYILFTYGTKAVWFTQGQRQILSSEKEVLSFDVVSPIARGSVDKEGHTIQVTLPNTTDLTSIAPIINVSRDATISPASGVAQDFTNPVTYTVRAQDGSTQTYTVTVQTATPTSVEDLTKPESVEIVYPNPFMDKLYIQTNNQESLVNAEVYTLHGAKVTTAVLQKTTGEGEYLLELPNISSNTYLLKLTYSNHTSTRRIVKTR